MVSADAKHQDIHTFDRSQATNIADIRLMTERTKEKDS